MFIVHTMSSAINQMNDPLYQLTINYNLTQEFGCYHIYE